MLLFIFFLMEGNFLTKNFFLRALPQRKQNVLIKQWGIKSLQNRGSGSCPHFPLSCSMPLNSLLLRNPRPSLCYFSSVSGSEEKPKRSQRACQPASFPPLPCWSIDSEDHSSLRTALAPQGHTEVALTC